MRYATSTKQLLALIGMLLLPHVALGAGASNSPLLHLEWDGCTPTAVSNRDFACDLNSGVEVLTASYTAEALAEQPPIAFTFKIVLLGGNSQTPSWWQTYSGGCRQGALTLDELLPSSGTCLHLASSSFLTAQQARIGGLEVNGWIILSQSPVPGALVPGETYFLANLNINHSKSTGPDSCAGCSEIVTAYFDDFTIETATPGLRYTYTATTHPLATWQGNLVPTRNTTWGRIKSQYR